MDLGNGLGHLSYSTLVHPGDDWDAMWSSLTTYVPQVKSRVCPDDPFGVSLRLAAKSAETLAGNPAEREKLRGFLADNDLYVYTVNAFVYGEFKGTTVKEAVYEPDWRTEQRVRYTLNVADILAEVAPAEVRPSIQTPPMGFKGRVTGPDIVDEFTNHVHRVGAHLVDIERRTGKTVTLAIEPEPHCFLETTGETVRYFDEHLYSGEAVKQFAKLTGLPLSEAHAALRRHIGVVYDVCHQAVEYEAPREALQQLLDAGIPVLKLQLAAALRVPSVTQDDVDRLKRFADSIYLTQTVEKKDGRMTRFLNIEDAFEAWERDPGPREWRTHFHVPVFLSDLGETQTTRYAIEEALAVHKQNPQSRQLEIETYTWDVLPDEFKTGDIVDYVSRELEWVRSELVGDQASPTLAGTTTR
jgi:sugar phosphate isomerase/epimerase